jgi:hypothetical protein
MTKIFPEAKPQEKEGGGAVSGKAEPYREVQRQAAGAVGVILFIRNASSPEEFSHSLGSGWVLTSCHGSTRIETHYGNGINIIGNNNYIANLYQPTG